MLGWFRSKPLPFGRYAEIRGAQYLRSRGYRLLACPYRARNGEVDIVADDGGSLVFVEVKARRHDSHPEDAVTAAKRKRIVRASRSYRQQYRPEAPYRYDILAVVERTDRRLEYRLIRDAFREESDGSPDS